MKLLVFYQVFLPLVRFKWSNTSYAPRYLRFAASLSRRSKRKGAETNEETLRSILKSINGRNLYLSTYCPTWQLERDEL